MRKETWGNLQVHIVGGVDGKGSGDGPVVVLLHGFGAPGDDLVGLWNMFQAPQGTRYVFPEAPIQLPFQYAGGRAWWMIDIARFEQNMRSGRPRELTKEIPNGLTEAREKVIAMLDEVEKNLAPSKLFIGGFSQGAMLSCDVVLRTDRKFDGLIMMSGTIIAADEWLSLLDLRGSGTELAAEQNAASDGVSPSSDAQLPKPPHSHQRKGLRVYMSHGTRDPLLPYQFSEELREYFTRAGLVVTWQSFVGGHEIPMSVLSSVSAFLREQ